MPNLRGPLTAILIGTAVMATAGCAAGQNLPSPDTASSSSAPDLSQTPAPTRSNPPENAVGGCRLDQLTITISDDGKEEGATGHRSTALLLRNKSSVPCRLRGYPKVVALDSGAGTVAEARQTLNGFMGGLKSGQPPTVTLAPGQAASALFETMAFKPSDGSSCEPYASLRVTPPEQPDSVTIRWGLAGCAEPQIHPIVPGSSGRA